MYQVNINFRVKLQKFLGKSFVIDYQVPPRTQKKKKKKSDSIISLSQVPKIQESSSKLWNFIYFFFPCVLTHRSVVLGLVSTLRKVYYILHSMVFSTCSSRLNIIPALSLTLHLTLLSVKVQAFGNVHLCVCVIHKQNWSSFIPIECQETIKMSTWTQNTEILSFNNLDDSCVSFPCFW